MEWHLQIVVEAYMNSSTKPLGTKKMTELNPDLFYGLPVELQTHIVSMVDGREHLRAMSTSSSQLRTLILPLLFREIEFGPLLSNDKLQHFAEEYAAKYGRHCREMKMFFSLGPLFDTAQDLFRADLFASVLRHTSSNIQKLMLDAVGSSLRDCSATLGAVRDGTFEDLRSLTLRCYDPEDEEITLLAGLLDRMATSPVSMPKLQHFALEGKWELSSRLRLDGDIDTSPIFNSLLTLLDSKSSLTSLTLSHMTIQVKDLSCLFRVASSLKVLTLDSLYFFTLQTCIESLIDTPLQSTLQVLSLHMDCAIIPSGQLRLPNKKEYEFSGLKRFQVSLSQGRTQATSDMAVFAAYGSLFRCSSLSFPALETVEVGDAFALSSGTARALASHILMARRQSMPRLKKLLCAQSTPDGNLENVAPLLKKCGITLQRNEDSTSEQ